MNRFGYVIREEDPFADKYEFIRDISPYATRIRLMWQSMRDSVLSVKPVVAMHTDIEAYMKDVEDRYKLDAYHSLSIEGYKVSVYIGRLQMDNNTEGYPRQVYGRFGTSRCPRGNQ